MFTAKEEENFGYPASYRRSSAREDEVKEIDDSPKLSINTRMYGASALDQQAIAIDKREVAGKKSHLPIIEGSNIKTVDGGKGSFSGAALRDSVQASGQVDYELRSSADGQIKANEYRHGAKLEQADVLISIPGGATTG